MAFWIVVGVLVLVVAVLLALALLRGQDTGVAAAEFDLQVYRDQLAGVEQDLERGVVSKEEAARIKTEVSRRILDADKALQAASVASHAPKSANMFAGILVAVLLVGAIVMYGGSVPFLKAVGKSDDNIGEMLADGSLAFYGLGAPGYNDLPLQLRFDQAEKAREARPSQAEIEAQMPPVTAEIDPRHEELVAKLRAAVAERPDDLKGHQLLAGNEAALGNYDAAYRAHIRVLELKGDDATAEDFADLADLMIMAAGGYVSPEAETALQKALTRDAKNGKARYYSGLMFAQNGRPDVAFQMWRDLLEASRPDDAWIPPIRAQIEDAAAFAGVDYRLPALPSAPAMAGPDADAGAAASDMTPQERQEMIQNMVSQLSERLASEGGSAQEWAQLIGALGVLGDKDRAAKIWGEAQQVFAGDSAALETIRTMALRAGVAE